MTEAIGTEDGKKTGTALTGKGDRMTKAEAIEMLKRIQEPEAWEPQINQAAFEALDMAIEALSQESSEDVISRQAAIDAICKEGTRLERNGTVAMCEIKQWCIDLLERLPSAQPEIIRCKDCKFLRLTGNVWKCQNRLVMMLCEPNDYCSRAERKEE